MAYSKRKRSVSRGRRSVKRKRYSTKRRAFRKSSKRFDPFPTMKTVKMRYCDNFVLDAVSGGPATYSFRTNSIFDPNYTSTGHQPYGHDQWQAVYNHYEVVASKITVKFLSAASGSAAACSVVGIAIKDDNTYETNFDTIREVKDSKYKIMPGYGISMASVTTSWKPKRYFPSTMSSELGAHFGNNPNDGMYYIVYVTGVTPTVDPVAVNCVCTIDFIVKMWEPKDLGQS
nr:MAG: capsid protein [Cressdnaviricota sp.]